MNPVVAAFNYMLFGRILRTYSELGNKSTATALGISDSWVTRIFIAFDVLSFLTQSAGAAMLATAKNNVSKSKTGQNIVIGGLVIQIVAFGFFSAAAVRFHQKMKKWTRLDGTTAQRKTGEWKPLLWCVYASCVLIMLRKYSHSPPICCSSSSWQDSREYVLLIFDNRFGLSCH